MFLIKVSQNYSTFDRDPIKPTEFDQIPFNSRHISVKTLKDNRPKQYHGGSLGKCLAAFLTPIWRLPGTFCITVYFLAIHSSNLPTVNLFSVEFDASAAVNAL